MPRIPLAAAFSIQIIVSLIAVASIVAVFAVINNNAVQTAAQDSAISSVKVAQEIIASPFKAVIPEIIALASSLKEKGALCTTYNVMGPLMVPQLQQMIPVLESNPQFFAVYQTYRLAIPYNPANTGSHSNYDYPWGDCGCVSDPNPLNNFCLHSQLIDPTIYGINTGWSLSSGLLPVNATPTGINPIDSAPFKYTQTIMKLTKEQAGGFWGTPEVYPLPDRLVPYVTFHVPLLFDDVTGFCTLAQNSDVNMGWLAGYLAQRDSPASHTIVIDLRASIILATSFDIPAFYIPNASEPLQNGQNWNITETPDPKLNDAVRRLLDYTSGNLSSISDPVVLIGSNTVVGAGKLQIGSLALLAVVVTDSSYFFQTGQQALITAILVGVAGFLLLAANVVVTVLATVRPLQDVSKRMQHTAQLRPGDELADFSSINEIRALQKSYCQMNVAVQSFVRYVPKDVVVDLLHAGQLCRISMDPMRVTIFFADVMNFTSICERVPPSELSDLILEYFNVTSRIVMRHGGIIDKFIGDCIMAIWGAPFLVASHEAKAVLCGLEVQRATHTPPCSVSFQAAGEVLGTRIGINCGEALAGNMGSHERMNYTVIGDAVNLAARLEGLGKQFNSAFLASEAVIAPHKDFFCTRFLCPVNVVGKDEPVNVYEVIGLWPDMNPNTLPHDDLVHIQGPTKDPNFSDQSDTASSISRMSQQTDVFRGETLQNLAREAIEPRHGVPLVVSDEMARRVLEYNKIVRLCIKRDAVAASTYLRELRRLAEEKPLAEADVGMKRLTQVGGPNDKAATILESWCDELSSLSPRAQTQWVGVYKADSK